MTEKTLSRTEILKEAFPTLASESIEALCEAAVEQLFPVGSEICRQGEVGNTLFVLVEGEAAVFVQTDEEVEMFDTGEVMVNIAKPYDYVGEMALLVPETVRSATIRAITDCHTLVIDRETFLEAADRNPSLLRHLVHQLTEHLRNNDRAVINKLRENNRKLEAAYANLAAQERIRREFVTTISHELRTPLTSIQGFLQLINKGMVKGDSLTVALDSITRNVEKMVGMTNNLLVLYEMQLTSPEFTDVTLPDVLVDAVHKLAEKPEYATDNVSIDISPKIPPSILGDKAGLTLALHAIIENAIKFSPQKTPVEIRVYPSEEPRIVRIDVVDQGIGIPPNMHEKIFEPFYKLEKRPGAGKLFDGIGIGLSIAKFIVEQHGGRVEVASKEGEGSVFSVFLPSVR